MKTGVLYNYKCRSCENIQEERHSIHDDPTIVCNNCGSNDTFRLIGKQTILFRGAGWTVNDSAMDKMGVPEHIRRNNKNDIMR